MTMMPKYKEHVSNYGEDNSTEEVRVHVRDNNDNANNR